jgi:hypothetical protein
MHPSDFEDVPDPVDRKPAVFCQTCEETRDGWAMAWLWGILVGIIWASLFCALMR